VQGVTNRGVVFRAEAKKKAARLSIGELHDDGRLIIIFIKRLEKESSTLVIVLETFQAGDIEWNELRTSVHCDEEDCCR